MVFNSKTGAAARKLKRQGQVIHRDDDMVETHHPEGEEMEIEEGKVSTYTWTHQRHNSMVTTLKHTFGMKHQPYWDSMFDLRQKPIGEIEKLCQQLLPDYILPTSKKKPEMYKELKEKFGRRKEGKPHLGWNSLHELKSMKPSDMRRLYDAIANDEAKQRRMASEQTTENLDDLRPKSDDKRLNKPEMITALKDKCGSINPPHWENLKELSLKTKEDIRRLHRLLVMESPGGYFPTVRPPPASFESFWKDAEPFIKYKLSRFVETDLKDHLRKSFFMASSKSTNLAPGQPMPAAKRLKPTNALGVHDGVEEHHEQPEMPPHPEIDSASAILAKQKQPPMRQLGLQQQQKRVRTEEEMGLRQPGIALGVPKDHRAHATLNPLQPPSMAQQRK